MQNADQKRFVTAIVLAWGPWLPTIIGLGYALRGISNSKATGLAAVAGGIAESLALWGLVTLIASQAVAIAWLLRGFSRDHWRRNLLAALSLSLSALMLLMVGGCLWLLWFQARHS